MVSPVRRSKRRICDSSSCTWSGPAGSCTRGAQEAEAVGQALEHAFGEDQAALFRLRLEDLEDQLLLAKATAPAMFMSLATWFSFSMLMSLSSTRSRLGVPFLTLFGGLLLAAGPTPGDRSARSPGSRRSSPRRREPGAARAGQAAELQPWRRARASRRAASRRARPFSSFRPSPFRSRIQQCRRRSSFRWVTNFLRRGASCPVVVVFSLSSTKFPSLPGR